MRICEKSKIWLEIRKYRCVLKSPLGWFIYQNSISPFTLFFFNMIHVGSWLPISVGTCSLFIGRLSSNHWTHREVAFTLIRHFILKKCIKPSIHTKTINRLVACGDKSLRNKFYSLVAMKYSWGKYKKLDQGHCWHKRALTPGTTSQGAFSI